MAKRVFISFDYDNDQMLKILLMNQAHKEDSPFSIADWSIKEASPSWKSEARSRIRRSELVIVICGHYTHTAVGVAEELRIAQEEKVPYFLLCGHSEGTVTKPQTALPTDKIYEWTWDNLKALVGGAR